MQHRGLDCYVRCRSLLTLGLASTLEIDRICYAGWCESQLALCWESEQEVLGL